MTKPDENGWRPIETAPGEGVMLVYTTRFGNDRVYRDCGRWFRLATAEYYSEHVVPTHWQPLPPAPKPPVTP